MDLSLLHDSESLSSTTFWGQGLKPLPTFQIATNRAVQRWGLGKTP
jgi:hypothetical protein